MGDLRRYEENEADDAGSYKPPYSTYQVELGNRVLKDAARLIDTLNEATAAGVKIELDFSTIELAAMDRAGAIDRWKADVKAYVPLKL